MKVSKELRDFMRRAAAEIRELRRANQILAAQVSVVRVFERALCGPSPAQGMSEDLAWRLEHEADQLDVEE